MSARRVSYLQATCDGCNVPYPAPNPDDWTEYRAEATAVLGGWQRHGADVLCPSCATLLPWQRPNGRKREAVS